MQLKIRITFFYSMLLLVFSEHAMASDAKISFYGTLDIYTAANKSASDNSRTFVVDPSGLTTSFIGVKSDIEIAEGTTGSIVLESFLRPDIGESGRFDGDTFYARDAFVGLSGSYGSFSAGRITTPYFLSVIQSNTFGGAFGFGPSIRNSFLGGLQGDSGWSNAISYSAPAYKGFTSSLLYSAGEIGNESTANKVGANAFYEIGKLKTTIALQSVDAAADDPAASLSDTQKAAMIGAKYDTGPVTISFQFLRMITKAEAGDIGYKTTHLGVTVPVGKSKILVSYAGTKSKNGDADEVSRNTGAIGYLKDLNKKINIYLVFYDDNTASEDLNASSLVLGGRYSF